MQSQIKCSINSIGLGKTSINVVFCLNSCSKIQANWNWWVWGDYLGLLGYFCLPLCCRAWWLFRLRYLDDPYKIVCYNRSHQHWRCLLCFALFWSHTVFASCTEDLRFAANVWVRVLWALKSRDHLALADLSEYRLTKTVIK